MGASYSISTEPSSEIWFTRPGIGGKWHDIFFGGFFNRFFEQGASSHLQISARDSFGFKDIQHEVDIDGLFTLITQNDKVIGLNKFIDGTEQRILLKNNGKPNNFLTSNGQTAKYKIRMSASSSGLPPASKFIISVVREKDITRSRVRL